MDSKIKDYEERLRIAMINDDCDELDKLMSDDMKFISHMGQMVTKQDDIDAHKNSLFSITNIIFRSQTISVFSDRALVISDAELELDTPNGIVKDHLIYTRLWKEEDEKYILIFGQATQVKNL